MLDRIREEAAFRGKGFILNKVYAAGLLIGPFSVDELIGGILEYPFSCALLGIGTFEQEAQAFEKEYTPIHFSFEEVIDRLKKDFDPIPCDRCQKCICLYGHEVHTSFRQFNYFHLGKEYWAAGKLKMSLEENCEHCRTCDEKGCIRECGRGLYIPGELERIYGLLRDFGDR